MNLISKNLLAVSVGGIWMGILQGVSSLRLDVYCWHILCHDILLYVFININTSNKQILIIYIIKLSILYIIFNNKNNEFFMW